jgi:phosphatidylinositol glycan class T
VLAALLENQLHETGTDGQHFRVFPKALGQVLWPLHVHSLSLSLSSGRWLTDAFGFEAGPFAGVENEWHATVQRNDTTPATAAEGLTTVPRVHHAPNGAELWAELANDGAPLADGESAAGDVTSRVDARWKELQAALAGLFCASLSQMSPEFTSDPSSLLRPRRQPVDAGAPPSSFRYATLPRESVCTENLAPFVKMLPCRRERGLAALLNPLKLFRAHFHSIQFRVEPLFRSSAGQPQLQLDGWRLRQSVTVLLDPQLLHQSPSWSLSQMLGTGSTTGDGPNAACACSLSQRAALHVHLPPAFALRFPSSVTRLLQSSEGMAADANAPTFQIGPMTPHLIRQKQGHTMLSYDLKKLQHAGSGVLSRAVPSCPRGGLDLSLRYTPAASELPSSVFAVRDLVELLPSHPSADLSPLEWPLRVERYLNAPSLEDGELFIHVHNLSPTHAVRVQLFDSLPWWCQIEIRTLAITQADGSPVPSADVLQRTYTPALHRSFPAQLSFVLRVSSASSVSVRLHFTKAMLLTSQYPPDVSRGFDIGSAIVRVWPERSDELGRPLGTFSPLSQGNEGEQEEEDGAAVDDESVLFYTDGLLLSLPFPDFSMPFNVIAFTSTILAFFFGSVLNMTAAPYSEVLKRPKRMRIGKDGLPLPSTAIEKIKAWIKARIARKEEKQQQAEPTAAASAGVAAIEQE